MQQDLQDTFSKIRHFHATVWPELKKIHQKAAETPDMQELADIAYAMRETKDLLHAAYATARQAGETAQKVACALWVSDSNNTGGPIRTEYCTATPKIKMMAAMPKKRLDPDGYAALMAHFGISEELQNNEAFRPHWPGMVDLFSDRLSAGKPLPPGIDPNKLYPVYSLTIRGKKDVDE
jgi:hypothetical protein